MSFGAIGSLIGSGPTSQIAGAYQQREADSRTWERSKEMFRMETELANTAHQRQVRDLQAAGLNPILSANMSGSSVPNGQVHQSQPFWTPDRMSGLAQSGAALDKLKQNQKTVDSAAELAKEQTLTQKSQQELNQAQKLKAQAEAGKAVADTKLSAAQAIRSASETKLTDVDTELRKLDTVEKKWNLPAMKEEAGASNIRGKMRNHVFIQALHELKSLLNPLELYKAVKPKGN